MLKDELTRELNATGLPWDSLVVDKDADIEGRGAVEISVIVNGYNYSAKFADNLGLSPQRKAFLFATNATRAINNVGNEWT